MRDIDSDLTTTSAFDHNGKAKNPRNPIRNSRFLTEDDAEKALDFLRDNAKEIGAAKAATVKAAGMLRVTKALVMKMHNDRPISVQEREAYCSKEYMAALDEDARAAGKYEEMRSLREAANMQIEAWRSEEATYRGMRL